MSARIISMPAALLLFANTLLAAQQPQVPSGDQPIVTLHATTHLVVLDVVVRDASGNPVKGLKPSDFKLAEDGVPQTLVSVTEHDASAGLAGLDLPNMPPNTFAVQRPAVTDAGSTVIMLGQMKPEDAPWVRKQVREYLEANNPSTPIAILKRDQQGTHLVQGLTQDRQLLLDALASKRILSPPPSFTPYRGPRGNFNLVKYLTGIDGRVNLIWFSSGGGGESSFPDLTRLIQDSAGEATKVLQLSRVALYPMDATGIEAPGAGTDAPLAGAGGETFHRVHNPPTGNFMTGGGLVGGNSTVSAAALATGGMSYRLHHGYKETIARVVDGGAHYYTLSYKPSNPNWNGAFRGIHLDVAASKPRGAWKQFVDYDPEADNRVQYRRGYVAWDKTVAPGIPTSAAPSPNAAVSLVHSAQPVPGQRLVPVSHPARAFGPPPTPMDLAMALGTPTPDLVHFTVILTPSVDVVQPNPGAAPPAGTFLTQPFQTTPCRSYRIHYRIDPKELTFAPIANGTVAADLQFVAVVYRDDGLEADSITIPGHVEFDPANYDRLMKTPLSFDQTIAVPVTGNFFLRSGVRDLASDRIGSVEIPVEWVITTQPSASTGTASR